jgi:hypothetical protein
LPARRLGHLRRWELALIVSPVLLLVGVFVEWSLELVAYQTEILCAVEDESGGWCFCGHDEDMCKMEEAIQQSQIVKGREIGI